MWVCCDRAWSVQENIHLSVPFAGSCPSFSRMRTSASALKLLVSLPTSAIRGVGRFSKLPTVFWAVGCHAKGRAAAASMRSLGGMR